MPAQGDPLLQDATQSLRDGKGHNKGPDELQHDEDVDHLGDFDRHVLTIHSKVLFWAVAPAQLYARRLSVVSGATRPAADTTVSVRIDTGR
jgi:hypothetical protein